MLCSCASFLLILVVLKWNFRNVNASVGQIRKGGRGEEIEALIIPALVQFNQTSVMCILYIIEPNGTVAFIESSPAMLIVQGISLIIMSCHCMCTHRYISLRNVMQSNEYL